jgi:hypothetical protein
MAGTVALSYNVATQACALRAGDRRHAAAAKFSCRAATNPAMNRSSRLRLCVALRLRHKSRQESVANYYFMLCLLVFHALSPLLRNREIAYIALQ